MSCAGQHPINNLENICCEIVTGVRMQLLAKISRKDAATFFRLE